MTNHELAIDGDVVRKRYLRTDRGQPDREWSTLVWLHEHAPGLAPQPICQEPEVPALAMSRVAGEPLDAVLSRAQTTAVGHAYRELFAVPLPPAMPLRFAHPAEFVANVVGWLAQVQQDPHDGVVGSALTAAATWHDRVPAGLYEICDPVVVQGDGNVANMLWDGQRVRLIDFEYSGVGDLAFEVADLVEHASSRLRRLLDPETVISGFELTPQQRERVDAYRIVLATFWLLMLLPGNPAHSRNPLGSVGGQSGHVLELLGRNSTGSTGPR